MGKEIYVSVRWNKDDDQVEVHPRSVELTDDVDWVCWRTADAPRLGLAVRFQGSEECGPFAELVVEPGAVRGFGNRGPDPRAGYPYEVVLRSPDESKSGHGNVINRATKPKPPKMNKGPQETPLPPPGPPDVNGN